jgi:hypothetical protein
MQEEEGGRQSDTSFGTEIAPLNKYMYTLCNIILMGLLKNW